MKVMLHDGSCDYFYNGDGIYPGDPRKDTITITVGDASRALAQIPALVITITITLGDGSRALA